MEHSFPGQYLAVLESALVGVKPVALQIIARFIKAEFGHWF
jgi:hypothetical protein